MWDNMGPLGAEKIEYWADSRGPKHEIQKVASLDINYHPQGKDLNDTQPEYQLSNEWSPPQVESIYLIEAARVWSYDAHTQR